MSHDLFYRPLDKVPRQSPLDESDGLDFWRGLRNAILLLIMAWTVSVLFALWVLE